MFRGKSTHVIVRSHHPYRRRLLLLVLVVAIAASGWLLFDFGRKRAGYDTNEARLQQEMLRGQIIAAETENRRLSAQIAALEQAAEIDRHAYDEVNRSLTDLQNELLELRQEVGFYRGIVNSEDGGVAGLKVQTLKLRQEADDRTYQYRLILSQIATTNARARGRAELLVSGSVNGRTVELGHRELLGDTAATLAFNLRHFQELKGQLALPPGFVPERLVLKLVPDGAGATTQEKTFSWAELIS